MKIKTQKVVMLDDDEKESILSVINILWDLQDAVKEEYDYRTLISDLEEIVYHEPWEVQYEL